MDFQTILSILTSIVTVFGLPLLIASLILLTKQLRIQTNQDIYTAMLSIDQFLVEHPDLLDYIYEGKALPTNDPGELKRVMASADMMLTFFEHVAGQRESMSLAKWTGWQSYIQDVYKSSPAIQQFWQMKKHWYDAELKKTLEA